MFLIVIFTSKLPEVNIHEIFYFFKYIRNSALIIIAVYIIKDSVFMLENYLPVYLNHEV